MKSRKFAIYAEPPQVNSNNKRNKTEVKPKPKPPKKTFYEEPPQVDTTTPINTRLFAQPVKGALESRRIWIEYPESPPSSAQQIRPKRKIFGKLAGFLDLRTDILFEIFQYFQPQDILAVSRLCKALNGVLMSKTSRFIWRQCMQNSPGLPSCPPGWIEPRWLDLCFVPYCNFCHRTYAKKVKWNLMMRICNGCKRFRILEAKKYNMSNTFASDPGFPRHYLIPNAPATRPRFREFYLPDYTEILEKFKASQDKAAFIRERRQSVLVIERHATRCSRWSKNTRGIYEVRSKDLRKKRLASVLKRLQGLGYGPEFERIGHLDSLGRHPLVNQLRPLTPKNWGQIRPKLIKFVESLRLERLQREHQALVLKRKPVAAEVLRKWKNSRLPAIEVLPNVLDFCDFAPINDVLQMSARFYVAESAFTDQVLQEVDGCVREWQEKLSLALGDVLKNGLNPKPDGLEESMSMDTEDHLSPTQVLDMLPLATTTFTCERCVAGQDEPYNHKATPAKRYRPLFYPEVLDHKCLTRYVYSFTPGRNSDGYMFIPESAAQIGKYRGFRTKWSATLPTSERCYDSRLASNVRKLVIAIGLNPDTTTAREMSERDDWFACHGCMKPFQEGTRKTYAFRWREAAQHWKEAHEKEKNLKWTLMTSDEATKAHEAFCDAGGKTSPAMKKLNHEPLYACTRCRDLTTEHAPAPLRDLYKHIAKDHREYTPRENKDFYKLFEDRFTAPGAYDIAVV